MGRVPVRAASQPVEGRLHRSSSGQEALGNVGVASAGRGAGPAERTRLPRWHLRGRLVPEIFGDPEGP